MDVEDFSVDNESYIKYLCKEVVKPKDCRDPWKRGYGEFICEIDKNTNSCKNV